MDLLVLSQTGAGVEGLGAAGVIAEVVAQVIVFRLDVVLQVAFPKKRLVASLVGAGKGAFVGVGALVFSKPYGTSIRFVAARKVAKKLLLSRTSGRDGASRGRGLG